jgi:hypothetical protein
MADQFPTAVYILCFLTSVACAWLLGRSFCFIFLSLNNLALVLDLVVWPSPEVDLRLPRLLLALAAALSLIWGFVWEVEER